MLRICHNWERCELNFLLWLRLAVYSITIQKNQRMSSFEYKNIILPFMRKAQKLNFSLLLKFWLIWEKDPSHELLPLLLLSQFSRVRLCATPYTAAHQTPLSLGFSRQEYWSGLKFPSPMHACMQIRFSHVRLYATLWTAAHQAPLSTGFSRQEYWSGLPFPSLSH